MCSSISPWMHFLAVLPLLQSWRQHFRFIPQSVSKLQSDWHFPLTVGVELGHTPEFTPPCPWTSELKSKLFDSRKNSFCHLTLILSKLFYVEDNKHLSSVRLMAGFILLQALHSMVYHIQYRLFYIFSLILFYLILFTGLFSPRVIICFSLHPLELAKK